MKTECGIPYNPAKPWLFPSVFPPPAPPPFFLGRKKQNKKKKKKNLRKTASNRRASKDAGRQWTVNGKDLSVVSVWPDSFLLSSSSRHESKSEYRSENLIFKRWGQRRYRPNDVRRTWASPSSYREWSCASCYYWRRRCWCSWRQQRRLPRRQLYGGPVPWNPTKRTSGRFCGRPPSTTTSHPWPLLTRRRSLPPVEACPDVDNNQFHFDALFSIINWNNNNTSTQQSYLFLVATRQRNDAFLCFCFIQHLTLLSQWQYVLGERSNRHTHRRKQKNSQMLLFPTRNMWPLD